LTQATDVEPKEKQQKPIVPYLRLPQTPSDRPYLWGSRCRSCGAAYLGPRLACAKCFAVDDLEEIRFSDQGILRTFSIVHQSLPGVEVPFVAAIIDLPEGAAVRANLGGIEPDPDKLVPLLGTKVEMYAEKARVDKEGNDVIVYKYRPIKG